MAQAVKIIAALLAVAIVGAALFLYASRVSHDRAASDVDLDCVAHSVSGDC